MKNIKIRKISITNELKHKLIHKHNIEKTNLTQLITGHNKILLREYIETN